MKIITSLVIHRGPEVTPAPVRVGQLPFELVRCLPHCLPALLALLLFSFTFTAAASDPVGIYGFVDKVILEPSDTAPERAQIWGAFAMAKGRGDQYEKAQRGYLYLTLRPGAEEISRKEWADLKSVAGTGQIVAFASRHEPKPPLRPATAKVENPEPHPKGWGLTKVRPRDYLPLNELVALQSAKPEAKPNPKSSSK